MGKLKRMDQIRLIIETYILTGSMKKTASRLNISKNTVRKYIRHCQAFTDDLTGLISLPPEQFSEYFNTEDEPVEKSREAVFLSQVAYWLKELNRVGVTRYLLWEEYQQNNKTGYGYSQFCERFRREIGRRDLTISLNHEPGAVLQVDFAGKKMHWVDASSGEVHECEVLVGVYPHLCPVEE